MFEVDLRLAMTAAKRVTKARTENCILAVWKDCRPATDKVLQMVYVGGKEEVTEIGLERSMAGEGKREEMSRGSMTFDICSRIASPWDVTLIPDSGWRSR